MQQEGRSISLPGFEVIDTVVAIDGARRNAVSYPSRSHFVVNLPSAVRNAFAIELMNLSVPVVVGVTDSLPYFLLSIEGLDWFYAGTTPTLVFAVVHPTSGTNGWMSLDKKAAGGLAEHRVRC